MRLPIPRPGRPAAASTSRHLLGQNGVRILVARRHRNGVKHAMLWVGLLAGVWVALACPATAHAYIGPGAGFAFAGSLLAMLAAFALALGSILLWPFTVVYRWLRVGNPFKHAQATRVVIVGMDGMDPGLATKFMGEGRMPNLEKLAERGVFGPLGTSNPSMSPVAWSTFTTGTDPSSHGIFDFITRDPCTYAPMLTSTEIGNAKRVVNIDRKSVV